MGKRHEKMIEEIADLLKRSGYNVIRIDGKKVPDLIASRTEIPIAIEVQTTRVNDKVNSTLEKSGFTKTLVICTPNSIPLDYKTRRFKLHLENKAEMMPKRWVAYAVARELIKQGMLMTDIAKNIQSELNFHVPLTTMHDWLKRGLKPIGFTEGLISVVVSLRNENTVSG